MNITENKNSLLIRLLLMSAFLAAAFGLYTLLQSSFSLPPKKPGVSASVKSSGPADEALLSAKAAPADVVHHGVSFDTIQEHPLKVRMLYAVVLAFLVVAIFEALCAVIALFSRRKSDSKGDVVMLTSFIRVLSVIAILLIIIGVTGKLTAFSSIVGAFAGMLLGWSLQAPVSGIAAWALVSIKRPFRVGDRVQFPNLGLVGDVMEVGFMYTKLNQVGGSVGSEDAIGRHILIPNAMLFSQVAINYTPVALKGCTYCLDEVVIRLTYDSDWDQAENILLSAARNVTKKIIEDTAQEPYIRADNWDYGVFMRLRFMTLATDRPRISYEILRDVFHQFQKNSMVDFAIPFIYSYRKGMEGSSAAQPAPGKLPMETEVAMENIRDPEANEVLTPANELRITQLAERIRKMGLLQPIVVERMPDGRCNLLAGRLRYLACRRLGWKVIPAIVRDINGGNPAGPDEMI
jgi:small-conductance mechanosensitive channel